MSLSTRIRSIDLLRGVVMVLMAIDHIRVYAGIPAGGPDPAFFFTRWVTHFCVSGFVFFAGVSVFLYGQRTRDRRGLVKGDGAGLDTGNRKTVENGDTMGLGVGDKATLARYLLTRGLWLVVLEMTVIRLFWAFNIHLTGFMMAGVIWMLGWCMVLMAAVIWLPLRVIGVAGLAIILFQWVFGLAPMTWTWWNFIYPVSEEAPGGINVLYVVVPWIGVMMAGYGFGAFLKMEASRRDRLCRWIGLLAIGAFLVAGSVVAARHGAGGASGQISSGQPVSGQFSSGPPAFLSFLYRLLGQQKYPPSLLFLLMTLGPLIALMPYAERARGWLADVLTTFGRVPLFYYILHILLIHSTALLVNWVRTGESLQGHYLTAPFCGLPEALRWHLPLLYGVFIGLEVILYLICRRYEQYKRMHPGNRWLKYL
ncbi:DUF1624 domain-containing protein [Puia sp.]|uniref:DUF1624 domain-containing protein n=1 Tax=Puia sp. TaxID=2045100 RepID=UPI002F4300AE